MVHFLLKDRPYSITGIKTAPHTYVFNKGALKKIHITTLNWAPYIGENICMQGWVQQLAVALLASQGYEITSSFLPWARTIMMAETGHADILYPEYFIEPSAPSDVYKGTRRIEHLALSRKLPGGLISFMKRKGEDSRFKGNLFKLKNEKIGAVRGYQNTPEFDALMDIGFFDISLAVDDLMNVKKLIKKRINLIIGDPAVIRFSVSASTLSKSTKSRIFENIEAVRPALQYNYLYFAVSSWLNL
ncbi:MAG: amino acid ABC transporter substrate-binding protein [Deltaproteobacteria bacterium]|nr:amino acid ABC transporter substrate-binding protein [Deltaproteobacteria bacterium]